MGVDLELEDELHSLILIDIACTQMDQTVFRSVLRIRLSYVLSPSLPPFISKLPPC